MSQARDRACGFCDPHDTLESWWASMSREAQEYAAASAVGAFAGYGWERESRAMVEAFRALVGPCTAESNRSVALLADLFGSLQETR